jgi:hypothetical protein
MSSKLPASRSSSCHRRRRSRRARRLACSGRGRSRSPVRPTRCPRRRPSVGLNGHALRLVGAAEEVGHPPAVARETRVGVSRRRKGGLGEERERRGARKEETARSPEARSSPMLLHDILSSLLRAVRATLTTRASSGKEARRALERAASSGGGPLPGPLGRLSDRSDGGQGAHARLAQPQPRPGLERPLGRLGLVVRPADHEPPDAESHERGREQE